MKKKKLFQPKFTHQEKVLIKKVEKHGLDKLSNNQLVALRVVVAKDAVAQVKNRMIIPESGTTIELKLTTAQAIKRLKDQGCWYEGYKTYPGDKRVGTGSEMISVLDAKKVQATFQAKPCFACAKGGALVAYVQRFDSKDGKQLTKERDAMWESDKSGDMVTIFTRGVLNDMEDQFELTEDECKVPVESLPEDESERFLHIMGNLIKSGGKSAYPKGVKF